MEEDGSVDVAEQLVSSPASEEPSYQQVSVSVLSNNCVLFFLKKGNVKLCVTIEGSF